MELILKRHTKTELSTIGSIYINNQFICYTLEDTERTTLKLYGKTAIPSGRYEIVLNYSNRFKRIMPLLLKVKNFEGVRIHSGNTTEDTEGCILVGASKGVNRIFGSRSAYQRLFDTLKLASKVEKIYITIQSS